MTSVQHSTARSLLCFTRCSQLSSQPVPFIFRPNYRSTHPLDNPAAQKSFLFPRPSSTLLQYGNWQVVRARIDIVGKTRFQIERELVCLHFDFPPTTDRRGDTLPILYWTSAALLYLPFNVIVVCQIFYSEGRSIQQQFINIIDYIVSDLIIRLILN